MGEVVVFKLAPQQDTPHEVSVDIIFQAITTYCSEEYYDEKTLCMYANCLKKAKGDTVFVTSDILYKLVTEENIQNNPL